MSTIRCHYCYAETSNGLALCDLCQRKTTVDMEFLPIYFRNLARWRPGHAGARPVPGSRVLYDGHERGTGTGDRISDRLDECMTALTTWARVLMDDRPGLTRPLTWVDAVLTGDLPDEISDNQPLVFAGLCAAFTERLTSMATLEWCGEFVRDLDHHEAVLRKLTEQAIPGWYAGECARKISMESTCGADTFVVPGLTWVTCRSCGVTTNASDHLDTILKEARGWVGRPKDLAGTLVALLHAEESVDRLYDRIRKWESLGWLDAIRHLDADGDPVGPKRYRLGDVLDLRERLAADTRQTG